MKRRKICCILLLAALGGMAFVGCEKDDPLAGKDYNTIITVKNSDAKTHYDNGAVVWDEGDQISVVRGNSSASNPVNTFNLEWPLGDNGVARFYGTIPEGASSDAAYFALYPAQNDVEVDGGEVTCEAIPHTQTLTTNTFGKGNNTSVGYHQSTTMQFRNVGGLAKIAVRGTEGVKSITITASGVVLSGRGTIDAMDNDLPITWASSGTFDNVVAMAANSATISVVDPKFFYVVMPPCTLSRYTVTITDGNDCQHSLTFTTPVTISRSKVAMLGAFEVRPDVLIETEVPTVPENNQICYTAMSKLNVQFFASATQHLYDPETGRGCVTYSSTVTSIPEMALIGNMDVTTVTLPATVTTIGEMAFYGCESLSCVTLAGVQTIGSRAFWGCTLSSIDLPEVRTIGDEAFSGCSLSSINLPEVRTIGNRAFSGSPLGGISLGSSIESIGGGAFSSNNNLCHVNCYSVHKPACDSNPFNPNTPPGLVIPYEAIDEYEEWFGNGWVSYIAVFPESK